MKGRVDNHSAHWSRAPLRTLILAAFAAIALTGGAWMLQYAATLARMEQEAITAISDTTQPSVEISSETQGWLYLSIGVLLAGLGLLIFVVVLERRRKRREGWRVPGGLVPGPRDQWPIIQDIVWIGLDPRAAKRFRLARALSFIVLALYLTANLIMLSLIDVSLLASKLIAYTVVAFAIPMIVLCLAMAHLVKRNAARRIGVRQSEIWFDRGAGNPERFEYSEVRVSGSHLLLGKRIINVIDQWRRPIFQIEELEGYLLSRISPEAFVSAPRLLWIALRRGSPAIWSGVLLIAFTLAVMIVDELHPGTLGKVFVQWIKAG